MHRYASILPVISLACCACSAAVEGSAPEPSADLDGASRPGASGASGAAGSRAGAAGEGLPSSTDSGAEAFDVPPMPDGAFEGNIAEAAFGACEGQHPACLDFETGALASSWKQQGMNSAVESSKAAHGGFALHFGNLAPQRAQFISTTELGSITNVLYGRFYLYMLPGAPNGHGALVEAYDQAGNWYELGFQFSAYHGNWHPSDGNGERWMNSKVTIPGAKWTCVEFLFDGSAPKVTQIWSDGTEVKYSQAADSPGPSEVRQFKRVEIGFRPFHGTSLTDYSSAAPPSLTDMWIDDIVLDSNRVGCLN